MRTFALTNFVEDPWSFPGSVLPPQDGEFQPLIKIWLSQCPSSFMIISAAVELHCSASLLSSRAYKTCIGLGGRYIFREARCREDIEKPKDCGANRN